jgi:tetratricopeptide (TPR) repeat protein
MIRMTNKRILLTLIIGTLAVPAGAQTPAAPAAETTAAPDRVAAAQAATNGGRWKEALALWNDASNRRPDDPTATAELGWAQLETGATDDARRSFNRAIRLDPGNVRAESGLVTIAIRALKPDEALRIARETVAANPNSAAAYRALGEAQKASSHRSDAEEAYRRAVDLDPKDAAAHGGYGAVLLMRNKAGDALREYRAAVRLDPASGAYREGLARAAMSGMRYGEAALAYADAMDIALHPKPDWERLDSLAQSAMDALGRASAGLRDATASREDVSNANTRVLAVTDAIAALPEIVEADSVSNPAMAQRALAYDLMGQAAASDLAALRKGTTSEASDAFVFREQARRALTAARAAATSG